MTLLPTANRLANAIASASLQRRLIENVITNLVEISEW